MKGICVSISPTFAAGDPPPSGYLAWQEWARVQYSKGLRQARCPRCGKWRFPQEPCCSRGVCPAGAT